MIEIKVSTYSAFETFEQYVFGVLIHIFQVGLALRVFFVMLFLSTTVICRAMQKGSVSNEKYGLN